MRRTRAWLAVVAVGVASCLHGAAWSQEVVAGEVWLGSQVFGVEDLEALDYAAKLSTEQKDAVVELMRSAMPAARATMVQWSRGYAEMQLDPALSSDWEKMRPKYAELSKRTIETSESLERDVMTNLKSLMTDEQQEGWASFERHRRRLILRNLGGRMSVDVLGMLRAAKITPDQQEAVAPYIDAYERALDGMVQELRPLLRKQGNTPASWYVENRESLTDVESTRLGDLSRSIMQQHVKVARQIAEALPEEQRLAFQKQRLFAEETDNDGYESFRGLPHIRSMLGLRSLSAEQRSQIKTLTRAADEELLRGLIKSKDELDQMVLAGTNPDDEDNERQNEAMRKLRFETYQRLMEDVRAVLSPDQRRAFETGIEDQADLERLFARRRYANDQWRMDRDLWDRDEERVPLASVEEE